MVERVSVGDGKTHITAWPIGEASLTTRPAGGMATTVMPIKQFKELADAETARSEDSPAKESEPVKTDAHVTVNIVMDGKEIAKLASGTIDAINTQKSTLKKENEMPEKEETKTNGPNEDVLKSMQDSLDKQNERFEALEAKNVELENAATIKA